MERLTRERGSVGRGRVYRRRRKKGATPGADPVHATLAERYEPTPERGVWSMVRGLFGKKPPKKKQLDEHAAVAPGDDPVRRILALPKGPARLDAFAETLRELTPGSHAQRAVALAFHRELVTMAEKAQVDLSLLPERVEACAEALVAAGEAEKAGQLLAQIGRRQRAAELFVAAGAIDDLDELHLHVDLEEGGTRGEAKLCYERFETLYVVGRRAEALAALEEAARLWTDNAVYQEILRTFRGRVLGGRRAAFVAGPTTIDVVARWPVVVGRGEDAGVRLKSPLVSRAHVSIAQEGGALIARDLDDRRAARVDGAPIGDGRALGAAGAIELVGVSVRYEARADALLLWAELQPAHKTIVARAAQVALPGPDGGASFALTFDPGGRAFALPTSGARVAGEPLQRPTLLLAGDEVVGPGFAWRALATST